MSEVKIATGIDRIWHWIHAAGIVALVLSGFNIHYAASFNIFGSMQLAVAAHNFTGWLVVFDYGLWVIYNLLSRRFRFYVPNLEDIPMGLVVQAMYYGLGIFRGAPHPFETDGVTRKFNPLQKVTYLGIMLVLVPAQIATGLVLIYYVDNWGALRESMVRGVSLAHTMMAYFFSAFVIGHIYLATTGHTVFGHFKMMITGKADH